MKPITVTIYILLHPITGAPFYVGSTMISPAKRIQMHSKECMDTTKGHPLVNKRKLMIKDLIAKGLKLFFAEVETVPFSMSDQSEKGVYDILVAQGYEILNDDIRFRYKSVFSQRLYASRPSGDNHAKDMENIKLQKSIQAEINRIDNRLRNARAKKKDLQHQLEELKNTVRASAIQTL